MANNIESGINAPVSQNQNEAANPFIWNNLQATEDPNGGISKTYEIGQPDHDSD